VIKSLFATKIRIDEQILYGQEFPGQNIEETVGFLLACYC